MLPKSATAGYTALMNPSFATSDPRLNLQKWDQDALRYEEAFGEKVTDTMRRSIYQNVIAPSEVQHHLLLNSANYGCAEDVRNAIEEFCEAKEEADATKTGMNLIGAVAGKRPRLDQHDFAEGNLGYTQHDLGKGKGGKHGQAGYWPKGGGKSGKGEGKDGKRVR